MAFQCAASSRHCANAGSDRKTSALWCKSASCERAACIMSISTARLRSPQATTALKRCSMGAEMLNDALSLVLVMFKDPFAQRLMTWRAEKSKRRRGQVNPCQPQPSPPAWALRPSPGQRQCTYIQATRPTPSRPKEATARPTVECITKGASTPATKPLATAPMQD